MIPYTPEVVSFNECVYAIVRLVPEGRVITYGTIARVLGAPGKAREVGWAMYACPIDVPAHRVINRLGAVSGDREGDAAPRRLHLEAEGVRFDIEGRCDLDACAWIPSADEIESALESVEHVPNA